ncbi:MAG: hypothetical protein ACRDP3_09265 [Streptomyces sp.]|uniref:hypothetical protein n=1 Tax=Streptomyces sp. TaxID=1931 RepID=UPI003D6C1843
MTTITELWSQENIPIRDALYMANGSSYDVVVNSTSWSGIDFLKSFDLDAHLASDPEWVSSIEVTHTLELADRDRLCCGEGSHGSEGFVGRIDKDGELKWVIYLEYSNPFIEIHLMDDFAVFRSSSDVLVKVDPDNPLR